MRCKCWSCDICRPLNKRRVVRAAKKGRPTNFITLTVRAHPETPPDYQAQELVRAWKRVRELIQLWEEAATWWGEGRHVHIPTGWTLARAARYLFRQRLRVSRPLQFIACFEATKAGQPHLHILARQKWIDQRWLSHQMKLLMDAPIVHLRPVKDRERDARYVAKYLGKDPHRFVGTKRYWSSRQWLDRCDLEDRPVKLPSDRWWEDERSLSEIEDAMLELGYVTELTAHRLQFDLEPEP